MHRTRLQHFLGSASIVAILQIEVIGNSNAKPRIIRNGP